MCVESVLNRQSNKNQESEQIKVRYLSVMDELELGAEPESDEYYQLLKFLLGSNLIPLYSPLKEQGITLELLVQCNETELTSLVPQLSQKIKLRVALEKLKNDPASTTVASLKRSSILDMNNVIVLNEIEESQSGTDASQPQHVERIEVLSPVDQDLNLNKVQDVNISDLGKELGSTLKKLLASSTQGQALLKKSANEDPLDSKDRAFLAKIVVEAELKNLASVHFSIRSHVWDKWANEIAHLFKEPPSLYYVPYKIIEGRVIQASGLFHNRLITHRRLLNPDRKRSSSSDSNNTTEKKKQKKSIGSRNRPLPADFSLEAGEAQEDNIDWLKSATSPEDMVKEKWANTFYSRNDLLQTSLQSYQKYFQTFPALTLPKGHELLASDFKRVYPDANKQFDENFPLMKTKILQLLTEKAENVRPDPSIIELLNLASLGEEQSNLAAFLAITILLRQMPVVNVPKKKLWKLSRDEVRNGFIFRVNADSDIDRHCTVREELITNKGIPEQPYIIAVGTSWSTIAQYELVMYKGMRYQFADICSVITNAYRIYWALDCAYARDSAVCWMFIQRAIYRMRSKFDIEGVPLRELLSLLKVD